MDLAALEQERLYLISRLCDLTRNQEQADRNNDEAEYDTLQRLRRDTEDKLDRVIEAKARTMYDMFATNIDIGAFAPRFQVAGPYLGEWMILDTHLKKVVETNRTKDHSESRAKEMAHFVAQRKQADRTVNRPLNLSTRRR